MNTTQQDMTKQQDMTEQQNKAATKLGGFTLNLPPLVDSSSIYELFYFNNGHLTTDNPINFFAKSLLINRTKHKAWDKSNEYIKVIKQDKANGVYFGFSNFGKIKCNMAGQDTSKRTALAYETHNDIQEEFSIAPTYKISLTKESETESKLQINIYNEDINTRATNGQEDYYIYSYEQYLQERFGKDDANKPKYNKNPNNKHCLTIPHAVSSTRINKGKFLFNIGLLNAKPNNSCTITFTNCDIDYNPEKLYSVNEAYPNPNKDILFDVINSNMSILFGALTSVNNTGVNKFTNDSFAGIFNEKHQYSKLLVKPKSIATPAKVDLTYSNPLPAEINDLRLILYTLRGWFDRSSSASTHIFPSFNIKK